MGIHSQYPLEPNAADKIAVGRNLPEEEAAALAAHRLAVRERELSAVAPCACESTLDEQVLFDFAKVLENTGLGPIQRDDVINQTLNAGLVIRRAAWATKK